MKRVVCLAVIAVFCFLCVNAQTKKNSEDLVQKIEGAHYKFIAQTVIPMSGKSKYLNDDYFLTVSKDTIKADLPYYGRSYTAPVDPQNIGILFLSVNFSYNLKKKNKKGWDITIKTNDVRPQYILNLSVGESGYATLIVTDTNRQPITFYGQME